MCHWRRILRFLYIYFAICQLAMALPASIEAAPGFGTKFQGLSANIVGAEDANHEGWNVAGLGLLDRVEVTFGIELYPFETLSEPGEIHASFMEYSKPTLRYGTLSVGFGTIKGELDETYYLYPYIGYSRQFLDFFSLGAAYSLGLSTEDSSLLNSVEQVGVMFNFYDFVHLGTSVENRGRVGDMIESLRFGGALIIPITGRNSVTLRTDVNTSVQDISHFSFDGSLGDYISLHNLHIGGELNTRYFSISGGIFEDLGSEGSQLEGVVEIKLSFPSTLRKPNTVDFSCSLTQHEERYFLTNRITYNIGESVKGKRYMKKGENLMSEHFLESAAEYFLKSGRLFLGEEAKRKAYSRRSYALEVLRNNRSYYQNGERYMREERYSEAIKEFEKLPSWSVLYARGSTRLEEARALGMERIYSSAKQDCEKGYFDKAISRFQELPRNYRDVGLQIKMTKEKAKQAKIKSLYKLAMDKYYNLQFDMAGEAFAGIVALDSFYKDAKRREKICAKLSEATIHYRRWQYNKTIEICDLISYEHLARSLRYKATGNIEYDRDRLEQAIQLWKAALDLEKESGASVDTYLANRMIHAEYCLAMEQAKQAMKEDDYDEAIMILDRLNDYKSAEDLKKTAIVEREAYQLYEEAVNDYEAERYAEAEKKLLESLDLDPDSVRAKYMLSAMYKDLLSEARSKHTQIYVHQEDRLMQEIEAELNMVVRSQYAGRKDRATAYLYLGAIYVGFFKDEDIAKEMFIRALEANPNCSLPADTEYSDVKRVFEAAKEEMD